MNHNQVHTQSMTPPFSESKDMIPCGAQVSDNGAVVFSMYAPTAKEVKVVINPDSEYQLERQENGVWQKTVDNPPEGFLTILFYVDGTNVINGMAPIGFGYNHPINFVNVPGNDSAFYEISDVPHGSVRHELYYSETTKKYEVCVVYTPPGYDDSKADYPVLYLQHGHGENENCWVWQGKVNFIMDNLLNSNQAKPCIIVMNNGMVMLPTDNGERTLNSNAFENLLLNDCIPFIEKHFRVSPGKENRAMAGLSMGSMQTSQITLKHPDLFSYAGIFSGFMRNFIPGDDANSHLSLLDDKDKFEDSFNVFFRAIGVSDRLIIIFHEDDEILKEKGLTPQTSKKLIRKEYSGSHEWKVWRECIRDFLPLLWKSP